MVNVCTEWNRNIALNRPKIPARHNSQQAVSEILGNLGNTKYDLVGALRESGNLSNLPLLVTIGRSGAVAPESFIKILSAAYQKGLGLSTLGRVSLAANKDSAFSACASMGKPEDLSLPADKVERLYRMVETPNSLSSPEAWVSGVSKDGSASILKALRLALQNEIPGAREVLSALPKDIANCVHASAEVKSPLFPSLAKIIASEGLGSHHNRCS